MVERALSRFEKSWKWLLALGNKIQASDRDYPSLFRLIKWKIKFNDCFRSSRGKISIALNTATKDSTSLPDACANQKNRLEIMFRIHLRIKYIAS